MPRGDHFTAPSKLQPFHREPAGSSVHWSGDQPGHPGDAPVMQIICQLSDRVPGLKPIACLEKKKPFKPRMCSVSVAFKSSPCPQKKKARGAGMGRDTVWRGDIPVLLLYCLIKGLTREEGDEGTRV